MAIIQLRMQERRTCLPFDREMGLARAICEVVASPDEFSYIPVLSSMRGFQNGDGRKGREDTVVIPQTVVQVDLGVFVGSVGFLGLAVQEVGVSEGNVCG